MRAHPQLLDYVFHSLATDDETSQSYGEKNIEEAKKWFLKTAIPVFLSIRPGEPKVPAITIALLESNEAESTLGDLNYDVDETTKSDWPVLIGPFAVESYDAVTGIVTVPTSVSNELVIVEEMTIADKVGNLYPILSVYSENRFAIKAGTIADFGSALIKSAKPQLMTSIESLSFKETYQIGCHAGFEIPYITYLHSIMVFILLRYKQTLLEKRGFERSVISSSQLQKNERFEMENVYSRFVNISGYVRQSWPKDQSKRLASVNTTPIVSPMNSIGGVPQSDTGTITGEEVWLAEDQDMLASFKTRR